MSVVHIVKVTGKSRKDLIKALHSAIKELGGDEVITTGSDIKVEKIALGNTVSNDDEYEEVESPFGNSAPTMSMPQENTQDETDVASGDLDSEGMPWDARIHASSKAKVADGTWRMKRGVDEKLVAQVKAELSKGSPSAPVTQAPPTTVTVPQTQAPQVAGGLPQMGQGGHTLDTFKQQFPMLLVSLINEGKLNQEYVNQLKHYFKVPEIWMLNDEQKTILFDEFVKYKFITRVG